MGITKPKPGTIGKSMLGIVQVQYFSSIKPKLQDGFESAELRQGKQEAFYQNTYGGND
jgi:hypothetical protein